MRKCKLQTWTSRKNYLGLGIKAVDPTGSGRGSISMHWLHEGGGEPGLK